MRSCEAGIEGAVHATRSLFVMKDDKEEWKILLVDAVNMFNAGNYIAYL